MEYKEIKKLIDDIGESKLSSIDIEFPDGTKIKMNRESNKEDNQNKIMENVQLDISNSQNINIENVQKDTQNEGKYVTSPMVGTFYSRPTPTAIAFVEVGSKVKKGDTLCIIESMKLMNEIEAEESGEVVEVLVKDEESVDYGKKLFRIV